MRIVLDTNVVVSGILSAHGPPAWIVESVLAGEFELVLDGAIRAEYEEVLFRDELGLPRGRVQAFLSLVDRFAWLVAGTGPWPVKLPDPTDERFPCVAHATKSLLLTGNLKHYPEAVREDVIVLSPRDFLEHVREIRSR